MTVLLRSVTDSSDTGLVGTLNIIAKKTIS